MKVKSTQLSEQCCKHKVLKTYFQTGCRAVIIFSHIRISYPSGWCGGKTQLARKCQSLYGNRSTLLTCGPAEQLSVFSGQNRPAICVTNPQLCNMPLLTPELTLPKSYYYHHRHGRETRDDFTVSIIAFPDHKLCQYPYFVSSGVKVRQLTTRPRLILPTAVFFIN
jgi:hypothetical protein